MGNYKRQIYKQPKNNQNSTKFIISLLKLMEPTKTKLQLGIQIIKKHLESVDKNDFMSLTMRLFPTVPNSDPYMCFYVNLKKYLSYLKQKGFSIDKIVDQIIAKAQTLNSDLARNVTFLLKGEPEFLAIFQSSANIGSSKTEMNDDKLNSTKQNNINNQSIAVSNVQYNFPPPQIQYQKQNQIQKQMSKDQKSTQLGRTSSQNQVDQISRDSLVQNARMIDEDSSIYKIGGKRPQNTSLVINEPMQQKPSSPIHNKPQQQKPNQIPNTIQSHQTNPKVVNAQEKVVQDLQQNHAAQNLITKTSEQNPTNKLSGISEVINDLTTQKEEKELARKKQTEKGFLLKPSEIMNSKGNQKPLTKPKQPRISSLSEMVQKRSVDTQNILRRIDDPFSSGRSIIQSPVKSTYTPYSSSRPQQSQVNPYNLNSRSAHFPPPPSPVIKVPQQLKTSKQPVLQKTRQDQNSILNISQKTVCLCEASCQNISLNAEAFVCVHCSNRFHKRCMKRGPEIQACVMCHLKLMIPNKIVLTEMFVGVMRKIKKRHEIFFHINESMVEYLKSRKDGSIRLQVRCSRLKPETNNQTLFPDSCVVSINGKQLKEFKPLHKQSSLKYRRDEPIPMLKHYVTGQNKLTVTEFYTDIPNALDRIQPEDHLIGVYVIEEETLNDTVNRIIREHVTSLQESKKLLNRGFSINEDEKREEGEQSEDSEMVSCEVIKIPLTCALTTEKLNFPARGIFCKHFQCFDLKNFIMMTSSSSNPRWVCPICKAPCYEFRIDCILTQILNQFTGCDKVQILMLYKNGDYEILDRDEDVIDESGKKVVNQPVPKNISQLKIEDRFKRQREKHTEMQLLRRQEEEKKKKRIIEIPPQDQIVSLVSDSD